MLRKTLSSAVLAATSLQAFAAMPVDDLPQPQHLVAAPGSQEAVLAARRYAAFWDTGKPTYAEAALAPHFLDRTLPAGRPQGVQGPLAASEAFRKAVPDLRAQIDDMVVAGDRVSVRLHFQGHFSGQFGEIKGQGQAVDFRAFDLYRVENGRIAENWHLEDNLTLLQQLGVVAR